MCNKLFKFCQRFEISGKAHTVQNMGALDKGWGQALDNYTARETKSNNIFPIVKYH